MRKTVKNSIALLITIAIILSLIPVSLIALAAQEEPTVRVSNVYGRAGETVTVSVTMSENSYACGGNFNLVYDNNMLQAVSASCGDLAAGMTPIANPQYDANKVRFTFAGITPITEYGTLVTVSFKILDNAEGTIPLTLEKVNLYNSNSEHLTKTVEHGSIIVDGSFKVPTLSVGSYNIESDEELTVNVSITELSQVCGGNFNFVYDNTKLEIIEATQGSLLNGFANYINTEYSENAIRISFAGVNPITEAGSVLNIKFRIISEESGTAAIALENSRLYDGDGKFISHSYESGEVNIKYIPPHTAKLSVQKVTGYTCGNVSVAVQLAKNSGVCGGNFTLKYDNSKMTLKSAVIGEVINDRSAYVNPDYADNKIRVSFAGTEPITDAGDVVILTFTLSDDSEGVNSLTLSDARMYDENGEAVLLNCYDGFVDVVNNGATSGDYNYIVKDGKATIIAYLGADENVSVPQSINGKPVVAIGDSAFRNCAGIKSVSIPEGIVSIESNAFSNCVNLEKISLAESVTTIGEKAFFGCNVLNRVELTRSVTSIGDYAFGYLYGTTKNENFAILGYEYTVAHDYANVNGIRFIFLDEYYRPTFDVTATADGESYTFGEWTKGTVAITLTNTSEYDGEVEYFYSIDGGEFTSFNGTLEIIDSGNYEYSFMSRNDIGRESEISEIFEVKIDNDVPTITSISQNPSGWTNAEITISVNAHDDESEVSSYSFDFGETWQSANQKSYSENCVVAENTVCVKDAAGNIFEYDKTITINHIDKIAPTVTEVIAERECHQTTIRVVGAKDEASGVAYYSFDFGETWQSNNYKSFEEKCTVEAGQILVKDYAGNIYTSTQSFEITTEFHNYSSWETVRDATCANNGLKTRICSKCGFVDSKEIESTGHSYGSWEIIKESTILEIGLKERKCKDCTSVESLEIEKVEVDLDKTQEYGLAVFTVVNAQTKEPIENANIFISTEKDGEATLVTDKDGKASTVLPVGKQTISAYCDGCITRNLSVNINLGENLIPLIGLSEKSVYDVKLTSREMTLEEIIAAGIDTSSPDNHHVFEYELKLKFKPEIDWQSILAYFNANGDLLFITPPYKPDPDHNTGESGEPKTFLHYHILNQGYQHGFCNWVEIKNSNRDVSLNWRPEYAPGGDNDNYVFDGWYEDYNLTKRISSVYVPQQGATVYGRWIYTGEDGGGDGDGTGGSITLPTGDGDYVTIHPVSEYCYLIISGEITWLKEMFDVQMLVINNSQTDTLENLECTIELPGGLSLATMIGEQQSKTQVIPHIPEGESDSVHWYVRGDIAGSYDLRATLKGLIMPFEEEINEVFVTENAIQVWAGNALHLNFTFPNAAYHGDDYPITITLTNVSDKTLYNVSHCITGLKQSKIVHYSDNTVKNVLYVDTGGVDYKFAKEFKPGDKIVMELTTNILFESELIEYKLEKYCSYIDGFEQLYNTYKAVKIIESVSTSLVKCISNCSTALDNFMKDATSSAGILYDKIELSKTLYSEISNLYSQVTTSGSAIFDSAAYMTYTGLLGILNAVTMEPAEWLITKSKDDIMGLLNAVKKLNTSIHMTFAEKPRKFNIFDSLRTAIMSIPVRFVLEDALLTVGPNSTTVIPWSVTKTEAGVSYFGVSDYGNYISNLIKACFSEYYNEVKEWYYSLIPGMDDPFNYEQVKQEIWAVEDEIAAFKAKDATGNVTFNAWVEESDNANVFSLLKSAILNENTDFEIYSNNENATIKNGVLTFTGEGDIFIIPQNLRGGTLVVEDSNGNRYEYDIFVVEKHECTPGDKEMILSPTKEYDGVSVRTCTVCNDILEVNIHSINDCDEHSYGEWNEVVAATCTYSGTKTRSCVNCGTEEFETVDKLEHVPGEWIFVEATENEGAKNIKRCISCEEIVETEYIDFVPLDSIGINFDEIELEPGKTMLLLPVFNPENASNRNHYWYSSDANIASIDESGNVTAKSPGVAIITLYCEGTDATVSCTVTVVPKSHTVKWVIDGVGSTQVIKEGESIVKPSNPIKEGYKFMGWTPDVPETMPEYDLTFTAVFEKSYTCPDCGDEILGEDAINEHIAAEARMKATIKIQNNSGSKTINYGETLRLTAITTNMPADAKIYWYIDGEKKGEGEIFNVRFESGTKTVEVKLVDTNGNAIKNASGNEIFDSESVTVKGGFFQKIISFFKNLFGMNRTVVQALFKGAL
ncbi:MAG: leucine-rich repeat protein [Clostridia bacterium]|nr:leucine-rich repeat protein [Clostridia bacterium]MBQ3044319.1 leucine-rich repeat protein [Clostridia bacterium]